MTRFLDRQKALELRKKELSYSQIKKILRVSKSTLSDWLSEYPLSKKRISELRDRNEARIEKFRETWRKKRQVRLDQFYKQAKKEVLPLTKKEIFIAGLFLYWGEGSKSTYDKVCLSNSDPKVIKFTFFWLTKTLDVPKSKIRVYLQLYSDMNKEEAISYWSKELNIDQKQFNKPYIKQSKRVNISHKGFGHGTCALTVNSTLLKERILMMIKSIADYYYNLEI